MSVGTILASLAPAAEGEVGEGRLAFWRGVEGRLGLKQGKCGLTQKVSNLDMAKNSASEISEFLLSCGQYRRRRKCHGRVLSSARVVISCNMLEGRVCAHCCVFGRGHAMAEVLRAACVACVNNEI